MPIVENLKILCKQKGISIIELERDVSLPKGTIKRWDENRPSVDRVVAVADYLNVSVDYLLGREEQKEKPLPFSENGALVAEIYDNLSDANKLKFSTFLLQLQKENEDK